MKKIYLVALLIVVVFCGTVMGEGFPRPEFDSEEEDFGELLNVTFIRRAKEGAVCAAEGDRLAVYYVGKFNDVEGRIFDESNRKNPPFEFTVGAEQVIQAWDAALADACVGDIRALHVPSSWAYGKKGFGKIIPPNANLYFEVEIVNVIKAPSKARKLSADQALILLPLVVVIAIVGFVGYRLLSNPAVPKTPAGDKKKAKKD